MPVSAKSLGIDRLAIEERLALVDEIWESIWDDARNFPLSDALREELEKRIAEDDAHPEDVIPWDKVKASLLEKIAK